MPTYQQLIKNARKINWNKKIDWILQNCPHKKASITKLRTAKPKKPNSAVRKIAKVWIISTGISSVIYIPGHGHSLQEHSQILIWGGWVPDLPGIHYKAIKGVLDFNSTERFKRSNRRSKFGTPKH